MPKVKYSFDKTKICFPWDPGEKSLEFKGLLTGILGEMARPDRNIPQRGKMPYLVFLGVKMAILDCLTPQIGCGTVQYPSSSFDTGND